MVTIRVLKLLRATHYSKSFLKVWTKTHSLPWAAIALNSTHNKSTILKPQTDQVKVKNMSNTKTSKMTNKKMMKNKKCKTMNKTNNR